MKDSELALLLRGAEEVIPKEEFKDDFFRLIGDILVDIIDRQEDLNIGYTDDRENSSN